MVGRIGPLLYRPPFLPQPQPPWHAGARAQKRRTRGPPDREKMERVKGFEPSTFTLAMQRQARPQFPSGLAGGALSLSIAPLKNAFQYAFASLPAKWYKISVARDASWGRSRLRSRQVDSMTHYDTLRAPMGVAGYGDRRERRKRFGLCSGPDFSPPISMRRMTA